MVIANGNHKNPIKKILKSKKCTWFLPRISKLDARKQWIIGSVAPKGEVIIDQGAIKAINNGKSLLPAGVKKINGIFEKGDWIRGADVEGTVEEIGFRSTKIRMFDKTVMTVPNGTLAV